MKGLVLFGLAALLAAAAPWWNREGGRPSDAGVFPGWPAVFEGAALEECPLGSLERAFSDRFPGRLGRFTDGRRSIVLRWVTTPTHRVHSAADCLRSAGWTIEPNDWFRDETGTVWSSWTARRGSDAMRVRERCYDAQGRSWPDVSSWFWAALLGRTEGPWWIVTVAESG